jgi:hypothetical protein
MGEAGETAICNAYATLDNAGLKASRFVGPVEIRGARGHVWLHGRRIPTWWLWVRGGGRITGFLFRAAWIAACFSSDWVPVPPSSGDEVGDVWTTFKTRPETLSWKACKSRLVSAGPTAHTLVSDADATLPTRMGVPRVNTDLARQALEKSRTSTSRIQVEIRAGRGRGMTQLYLEVPVERQDITLRALSGSATLGAGRSGPPTQDGAAEATASA